MRYRGGEPRREGTRALQWYCIMAIGNFAGETAPCALTLEPAVCPRQTHERTSGERASPGAPPSKAPPEMGAAGEGDAPGGRG